MRIKKLEIKHLKIPFKLTFKHATAERAETESVLIRAESESGKVGYGEGCPRSYVTGEDISSALSFFESHRNTLLKIHEFEDLQTWVEENNGAIDVDPAAWCAIELALLDLLGKEKRNTVEEMLGLPKLEGQFQYTAVLGTGSYQVFNRQVAQYLQLGFTDFKIKLSGDLEDDLMKFSLLKDRKPQGIRIRIDANNLWKHSDEAIAYIKQLGLSFFAIEEPLQANRYDELQTMAKTLQTKIILDESFLRKEQFSEIKNQPDYWIVNIRISKMGGLLRSLAIAEMGHQENIGMILGAQVGETSILTRAALVLAHTYKAFLLAQEGAFGTHLLKFDLTKVPLMFGNRGILDTEAFPHLNGVGLGITNDISFPP